MSKWCDTCVREPYDGCNGDCPVCGKDFEELAKTVLQYEKLKSKLEYLKSCAETVENYEDSVFSDYRSMAEHDMREIVDILVGLEI